MKSLVFVLLILVVFNYAAAATVPDPPSSVYGVAVLPTQINLFWSAPANDGGSQIIGYKIDYKVGSGSFTNLVSSTTVSYFEHTGLTTAQTYTYRIYAVNSFGSSAPAEVTVTPTSSSSATNPDKPPSLNAAPVSPTSVNLVWSAPANNGGYPVTGYKIEYRVGGGPYTTLVSNTQNTAITYSHTGLVTNQVYIYRVFAITSFGTSQASAEAIAQPTTSSSPTPPGQPQNLSATAVSSTQINLVWNPPASSGSFPVSGYKIEVKTGGSYTTLVSNTASTQTTYQHTNLNTGTSYTYRVSAVSPAGTGASSAEASATPTSSSVPSTPGAPTNLSASASQNKIELSWNAPQNVGGYPITGYKIEYRTGSTQYTTLVQNTASQSTTYSHTNISQATTYIYRVYAINSVGIGLPSSEFSVAAEASGSVPGAPTSFVATAASPTQINLSWTPPSGQVTGYKIEVKKANGSFETLVANTQSTTFFHTGLVSGTTYYYRIYASNSAGTSPPSEASATPKETTTPALTATAVSPSSIRLSWVAPSQTYKQQIVGYKISEKIGPDNFKTIIDNTNTQSTTYTVTGLQTDKTYTYVVSALFSLGSSPPSNEASATPLASSTAPPLQNTANPPGAPAGLSAVSVSPTQINLSWNAPANNGGSPIVGYKIEVKKQNTQYDTLANLNSTKYSHLNLTNGTYTYRVFAINEAGTSPPSAEASATTQSLPKPTLIPLPPSSVSVTLLDDQAKISWTPSSGAKAYKIEYKIGTDSFRTLVLKTEDTIYTHKGLLENTYTYRVFAINEAGTSAPSKESTVRISKPVEPPQTPPPATPPPPACGPGTIPNQQGICVLAPAPAPQFPDPTKDPYEYIKRYNSEATYREWFDRNFPGKTIYEVVGVPEPKKPAVNCGPGTHVENGLCVPDEQNKGGCLIATATYGTELAPQVQTLRELRENILMKTNAGSGFLAGFNDIYYVFSPTVADWERQSPAFKEAVRILITPMLYSLTVLNYAEGENSVVVFGVLVILLNVAMYSAIPVGIFVLKKKVAEKNPTPTKF